MKKCLLIFMICLFLCQPTFASEVSVDKINDSEIGAMGAVLMDGKTGRVLWGKNERTKLPMASTTKIMTAIIVLENANLNDIVKVSKRASKAPEVKMHLKAGEEIKLEYLMYALMLQSSNDAAVAIAEHVGGSVEEFCKMMTEKAHELGATDTMFETPNGLDSDNHYSTAYDMALITKYALQNPEFIKITNTSNLSAKSNLTTYSIQNKNRFLHEYEGANGVKTGFTGKAGQCFVGSAKRGDMQLITVVLASGWGSAGKEQKWKDTKKMMTYGFKNYEYKNIITENAKANDVQIERSKTPQVGSHFKTGLMLPLTKDEAESIFIEVEMPKLKRAPVAEGEKIGTAKVFITGKLADEIDIVANESATRHDLKTSLEKVSNQWIMLGTNETTDLVLPEF